MASSRFLHPYYFLNGLLLVSYALLRNTRLDPKDLSMADMFGITREAQVYISLFLILFTRALSAPTLDAYLSSAFMFSRAAILFCLYRMNLQFCLIFAALWTLLYIVCPQPRYRLPESILTLNHVSFQQTIADNNYRTIHVLWCHATWSARCSQLAPVLAALAKAYTHPRIKFCRLDVSKFPGVAEKLSVSISAASKQLPTLLCFVKGKEVARIPIVDSAGRIPVEWKRGFKPGDVARALQLDERFAVAKRWEEDARKRYRESAAKKKRT